VVFRTIGILLRFLRFLRYFENPKSRDFLRFFAVFRTFSRTMGIATEIASISVSVAILLVLPVWGYSFYFRFVPDAVLRSWTMSVPVEVDRACPKTVS